MSKVQQKKSARKEAQRRVPANGSRKKKGASRARTHRAVAPKPDELITVKRWQLEQSISDLSHAQRAAIEGAVPPQHVGGGPARAIDAFRQIESVRKRLYEAMVGAP
jgi:hypothetical protein